MGVLIFAVQTLTSHLTNHARRTRLLVKKKELISDVRLWTSAYGHPKVDRPAKDLKLCADTGCCLKDLPGAMDDSDG